MLSAMVSQGTVASQFRLTFRIPVGACICDVNLSVMYIRECFKKLHNPWKRRERDSCPAVRIIIIRHNGFINREIMVMVNK